MAINATSNSTTRELIKPDNYVARCYSMVHIGTIDGTYMGQPKKMNKVRIGWELPTETKVFDPAKGEQPIVFSKEFTLSMADTSHLRKVLASWRGKDFTKEEARSFDITKLLGAPCMLNIIHKQGTTDPSKTYEEIGSISPMPKGIPCPPQVNPTFLLDYENFTEEKFNSLPDWIKEKMASSKEYKEMKSKIMTEHIPDTVDDLPF